MTFLSSLLGIFRIFSATLKNLWDCVTTGVKQLNSARQNQNFSKWSSLDETRVWQLPLFTYPFIENEKVSKDKDTNFILAILPFDRLLAENPNSETCQRKNVRGIRYIKQDLEVLKSKGDIEVSTKDSDSLWKGKEPKTLIVSAK